jgi:protein transport protein SEC61 subunit gamma-like protein
MGIFDRFDDLQHDLNDWFSQIGKGRFSRILRMARKPTHDEYIRTAEITSAGLALIGGIGFLIYLIFTIWLKIP